MRRWLALALLGCTLLSSAIASPAPVAIATAANLAHAIEALNAEFKRAAPEIRLTTAVGASGSLFAQARNGAPFDVFLSADTEYPRALVSARAAEAQSLRVFATGRLVAWTTRAGIEPSDLASAVRSAQVKKVAIAQPATAPYGRAAQAALETVGAWREVQPKLVFGESIAQTAQFVETGNADLGLVAMSIVLSPRLAGRGRWIEVPATLHAGVSLEHAAVLTTRGAANPSARRYLEFLGSAPAKKILREFGYGVPD